MRNFVIRTREMLLFLTLMAASSSLLAVETLWGVSEVTGTVQYQIQNEKDWRVVKADDLLPAPFYIKTADASVVVLKSRLDETRVGANSIVGFMEDESQKGGIFSRIIQQAGSALFKIQKMPTRALQVESPYLVSVVKGTTFTVQVGDGRGSVSLIEGLLEVNAVGVEASVLLHAGEIASIAKGDTEIEVIRAADVGDENDESSESNTGVTSLNGVGMLGDLGAKSAGNAAGGAAGDVAGTITELTEALGLSGSATDLIGEINALSDQLNVGVDQAGPVIDEVIVVPGSVDTGPVDAGTIDAACNAGGLPCAPGQ